MSKATFSFCWCQFSQWSCINCQKLPITLVHRKGPKKAFYRASPTLSFRCNWSIRNRTLFPPLSQWISVFKPPLCFGWEIYIHLSTLTMIIGLLEQALLSLLHQKSCNLIQRDVQPHGEAAASGEEAGSGPNIKGSHNCSGMCVPSRAAAAIISYILWCWGKHWEVV